jgi:hypothetical protein
MVLPEIGGRIHVGLDKTNGYDFSIGAVLREIRTRN